MLHNNSVFVISVISMLRQMSCGEYVTFIGAPHFCLDHGTSEIFEFLLNEFH